jgi:hypothetical protein
MKRLILFALFFVSLVSGLLWYGFSPAEASPQVQHLFALPGKLRQTQGETQFGSTSYIAFTFIGVRLTPRQKYDITSDFLQAGACSDWSINGIDQKDAPAPFSIVTDRQGVFGVGILATGCLPGKYTIEASHEGVGSHFTTSVSVS